MWKPRKQGREGNAYEQRCEIPDLSKQTAEGAVSENLWLHKACVQQSPCHAEKDKSVLYKETSACLTAWKKQEDLSFLKEPDSVALQQALRDLDTAYRNFFEHRGGYPKFRKKHDHRKSYRTHGVKIVGKYLYLPKAGYVRIRQSMEIGKIGHATITQMPSGRYYAVLNVEFEPEPRPNKEGVIGLDMGLKTFYADSRERTVENPEYLKKSLKKLARAQRCLSRRKKGGRNWEKQRLEVANYMKRCQIRGMISFKNCLPRWWAKTKPSAWKI